MKRAWDNTKREPVSPASVNWNIEPVALKPAAGIENLEAAMKTQTSVFLSNNLSKLVWLKRLEAGKKIDISLLSIRKCPYSSSSRRTICRVPTCC
jgi:hypothetical protein